MYHQEATTARVCTLTSKHPAEGRAVTGSHLHITSEPLDCQGTHSSVAGIDSSVARVDSSVAGVANLALLFSLRSSISL